MCTTITNRDLLDCIKDVRWDKQWEFAWAVRDLSTIPKVDLVVNRFLEPGDRGNRRHIHIVEDHYQHEIEE